MVFYPSSKNLEDFRDYSESSKLHERVERTYKEMHTQQTYAFVEKKEEEWCGLKKAKMSILDVIRRLDELVDESDPDIDLPNSVHAFQTAERIRAQHPHLDWLHLTGLIHDSGKMLALWDEPQFSVVGDTFPVGCAFSDKCVFGLNSFADNPDRFNENYNKQLGIYKENCGLRNVKMSWGHDEYLFQVLSKNKNCHLPEIALYIIKFHSFYPYHTEGEYSYLCDEYDVKMLPWLQLFNKFDLYSKSEDIPNVPELLPYYQSLVDKYIPGELMW